MITQKILRIGLAACGLGLAFASRAQNPVTFQVDMNSQTAALTTNVYIRGGFNGWGTPDILTNNGAGIFSGTVSIAGTPGSVQQCKFFYYNPGETWEGGDNRQFILAGGEQTLPLTTWNVSDWPTPTNDVTFRVDMSAQILLGSWSPDGFIRVAGAFTGWGDGADLTNNPALSGSASNVYSMQLKVVGFPGATSEYKFRANGGWESPASTGGNNRVLTLAGGDQVLPLVFYNDASACDLLPQDTTVTFRLHITNGTTAIDGTVFNRATHEVKINGQFNNWNSGNWDLTLPAMVNAPMDSEYYEHTVVLPKGSTIRQTFKFGLSPQVGANIDNEAASGQDHVQYVRTLSDSYVMPIAEFGTNHAATRVESSFGDLKVGAPSGGTVPLTWLGRPCVTLQVRSSLTGGDWEDIPTSESEQSTNWPISTGSSQFFRLQKRP